MSLPVQHRDLTLMKVGKFFLRWHIPFRPYSQETEKRALSSNAACDMAQEFVRNILPNFFQGDWAVWQEHVP